MNKEILINRLNTLEKTLISEIKELREIIEAIYVSEKPTGIKTKEESFFEIIKDLSFNKKIKIWSKNGKNYFYQDEKNGCLWCSYSLVWSIFESEFGMEYEQIQAFIKDMVDEHLKIKGLTPYRVSKMIFTIGG